jgi:hypothetical protein
MTSWTTTTAETGRRGGTGARRRRGLERSAKFELISLNETGALRCSSTPFFPKSVKQSGTDEITKKTLLCCTFLSAHFLYTGGAEREGRQDKRRRAHREKRILSFLSFSKNVRPSMSTQTAPPLSQAGGGGLHPPVSKRTRLEEAGFAAVVRERAREEGRN